MAAAVLVGGVSCPLAYRALGIMTYLYSPSPSSTLAVAVSSLSTLSVDQDRDRDTVSDSQSAMTAARLKTVQKAIAYLRKASELCGHSDLEALRLMGQMLMECGR